MWNKKSFRVIAVLFAILVALSLFGLTPPVSKEKGPGAATSGGNGYVSYSEFAKRVEEKKFSSITQEVGSSTLSGVQLDGEKVYTVAPFGSPVMEDARKLGVSIYIMPQPTPSIIPSILLMLLPVLLLIGFMYWMYRRQSEDMRGLTRGPGGSGQQKIKEWVDPRNNPHRLADVAGCDEAKKEVAELVEFLKNPEMYTRVGARSPKGVLMAGPPGTGKTLLAKAIAGEAGVPFFSVSGSDFVEMFVGVGAGRVRALFDQAKKVSPAIVFIDEIDAVGRQRSSGHSGGGGHEEREQTLNALLVEMDGFTPSTNVVVIAATNRSDVLDEALRRPGRFDREVTLSLPDRAGRAAILAVHGKTVPIAIDVSWLEVAKGTPGFSGADLANLINEAALLAARTKEILVTVRHLEEARDKIIMGVQRSSMKNEEERRIVAYHEAGHAVVAHATLGSEPIHKISIVPRGRALGVTVQLPKEDSYNHSSLKLRSDITVLMGGRAAEDVALNQSTVGASNDFMRATVLARRMIASWGMDPDFGPMSVDGERGNDWVGSDIWSEDIKKNVDTRVQVMLKSHYATACQILTTHRDALEAVAMKLLDQETIDAAEFEALMVEHNVSATASHPADPATPSSSPDVGASAAAPRSTWNRARQRT